MKHLLMYLEIKFQSTLLQEERRHSICFFISKVYFNPRSYKRSDRKKRYKTWMDLYFNPRSYKRSDGKNAQLSLYLSVIIIA